MENQDEFQALYDKFLLMQKTSEYTISGTVETLEGKSIPSILVKPDLITSPALRELMEEFDCVYLNDRGLNIFNDVF